MSSGEQPINYAKAFGFESLPAAVVVTILYVPLLVWFIIKSFKNQTEAHYMLTVFCAIRTVAFAIRAVLTGSESAGENFNLFLADEVLSAVGFFGLLYSAYSVVLELGLLAEHPPPKNPLIQITQNRRIFRLATTIAVILGVISVTSTSNSAPGSSSDSTSTALRYASTIIFLVLTVLQLFQTIYLAKLEASEPAQYTRSNTSFGRRHGILLLVVISVLLLVREGFTTATLADRSKQLNEKFWYPLIAAPELLAVLIFSIPGLAPTKRELPRVEGRRFEDWKLLSRLRGGR